MSNSNGRRAAGLIVASAVAAILAACASAPEAPAGSAAVRTRLTTLKSQPLLAEQVPTFLQAAEQATVLAETPQRDAEIAKHRVYLADRAVETARATAEARLAESQRAQLRRQSDESRLAARTREAEAAQRAASAARADAERSAAEAARIGEDQRFAQRQQNEDARVALRTLEADAADRARNDMESARLQTLATRNEADAARNAAEAGRIAESQRAGVQQQADAARVAAQETEAAQRRAADATRDAATQRMAEDNRRIDAERARNEAESTRNQAAGLRNEADAARNATEAARLVAQSATDAAAATQNQELARQIAMLQGKTTERGIVLTLGDVLFASGSDQLKPGAVGNLDRLVAFMGMFGDRSAMIEGHTDSVGDAGYNEALSQRRADSVKAYLAAKGVAAARLISTGKGEGYPVSGNESAGGRQQNRRVEVIIGNDAVTSSASR